MKAGWSHHLKRVVVVLDAEEESSLLVPALDCQPQDPALPAGLSLDAGQVVIHHVEHLHIHTPLPAEREG